MGGGMGTFEMIGCQDFGRVVSRISPLAAGISVPARRRRVGTVNSCACPSCAT